MKISNILALAFVLLFPVLAQADLPNIGKEPTDAERATFADSIDAEVATLSPADQKIVAKIQKAIKIGKQDELDSLKAKSTAFKIQNVEHRRFWNEVVIMASTFRYYDECFARGFWFMLYAGNMRIEDKVCTAKIHNIPELADMDEDLLSRLKKPCYTPDYEHERLNWAAQMYNFARGGAAYVCK